MTAYQIKLTGPAELAEALKAIGADLRSLPFFENKREIKAFFISGADVRGANVIKQELLSLGGDAAVHAHAIDCGVSHSDVILFGTGRQLSHLADKLDLMPWWGLTGIAGEIRSSLLGVVKRVRDEKLPSGTTLRMGARSLVMGIINLTDDSFYKESRTGGNVGAAIEKAVKLAGDGADILDLGAESTRPGSTGITEAEEIARLVPAVREIRRALPQMPLSIDTTRPLTARMALEAGADIINDISGLTYEPELAKVAADFNAMLVLMHMRGRPETMQTMCQYDNLLLEISRFFETAIETAASFGLDRSKIILDPGIGFAKTYEQNLFILRHLKAFDTFALPLLIGVSRKGTIGMATDSKSPEDRLEGTIAVSALCAWHDVEIVRVHDVLENKKAIMMAEAIKGAGYA